MGVPACLWRRTGEIYKGNREFSELVGVDGYMMRDVRLRLFASSADEWHVLMYILIVCRVGYVYTSSWLKSQPSTTGKCVSFFSNPAFTNMHATEIRTRRFRFFPKSRSHILRASV
jgi:hypothetical protein